MKSNGTGYGLKTLNPGAAATMLPDPKQEDHTPIPRHDEGAVDKMNTAVFNAGRYNEIYNEVAANKMQHEISKDCPGD